MDDSPVPVLRWDYEVWWHRADSAEPQQRLTVSATSPAGAARKYKLDRFRLGELSGDWQRIHVRRSSDPAGVVLVFAVTVVSEPRAWAKQIREKGGDRG